MRARRRRRVRDLRRRAAGRGEGELIVGRLQAKLAEHNAEAQAAGRPYRIALTAGVAELEHGDLLDEVLERSDAALYAGKQALRAGAGLGQA